MGETYTNVTHYTAVQFRRKSEYYDFCVPKYANYWMAGTFHHNTSVAAAAKTANFILRDQMAPRPNTPFWIISNTYDQVCGVCWAEKLFGNGFIPESEIWWDHVRWHSVGQNWPLVVPLFPWKSDHRRTKGNWVLEFKSYEQGRRALQARSIGGFWFSEQFPLDLFLETLRGCREYMFPGGQFAEFTPIEPELCMWVEKVMDDPPPGWKFYRANTEMNKGNLAEGWYDQFFATVPDEMIETRKTGALATYEGVIYEAFNPAVHIIRGEWGPPPGCHHWRGVDWGASTEHPFACTWVAKDGAGDWYVYDEYWNPSQKAITEDHAKAILAKSYEWGWPLPKRQDAHYHETFADPSRPGDINAFNVYGIPTHPAFNEVYKGIDAVRGLLKIQQESMKPKLYIHERCVHLIEEIRKYRWMRGKKPTSGNVLNPKAGRPVPLKRADDLCDAMRYAIASALRGMGMGMGSMRYAEYEKRRSVKLDRHAEGGLLKLGETKQAGWFSKRTG